jgi:hypothetical protein
MSFHGRVVKATLEYLEEMAGDGHDEEATMYLDRSWFSVMTSEVYRPDPSCENRGASWGGNIRRWPLYADWSGRHLDEAYVALDSTVLCRVKLPTLNELAGWSHLSNEGLRVAIRLYNVLRSDGHTSADSLAVAAAVGEVDDDFPF